MGVGVNIFGIIDCPGYGWQREDQRIFRHNKRVIEHLPQSDSEWPFITRSMFSLLPFRTNLDDCIPQYENQLIHFAGSYKNMYLVEADWLTKFELVLSQLCFFSAKVINDFSGLEYEWDVNISSVTDEFNSDPPRPSPNWSFSVHKLERQPIEFCDAIDGTFTSSKHSPRRSGT